MMLEDIGEGDDALLCITNQTSYIGEMGHASGNWFFPNESRVASGDVDGGKRDIYRNRGWMVVRLHRRRGGVEGIYRCEIADTFGIIQTLYIGVYSANTGEWYVYTSVL